MAKETFVVNGMTCASCVANVENAVNKLDGVDKAVVNLTTEKMSVDYAGDKVSPEAIEKAVADAGYEAEVYNPDIAKSQEEREEDKIHKVRERLIWSSIFTVPLFYLAMGPMVGLPVPNFLSPHHAALTYALVLLVLTVPVIWQGRSAQESIKPCGLLRRGIAQTGRAHGAAMAGHHRPAAPLEDADFHRGIHSCTHAVGQVVRGGAEQ